MSNKSVIERLPKDARIGIASYSRSDTSKPLKLDISVTITTQDELNAVVTVLNGLAGMLPEEASEL